MVEKGASSLGKYIFPIYKYIITYRISSSYFLWFTSFKTNKRSNRQERKITPKIFYGIHSKVKEVILTLIQVICQISESWLQRFSRYRVDKVFLLL